MVKYWAAVYKCRNCGDIKEYHLGSTEDFPADKLRVLAVQKGSYPTDGVCDCLKSGSILVIDFIGFEQYEAK